MSSLPAAWAGFVDDAAVFPPGDVALPDAVEAYRGRQGQWYADLVGPLVVTDTRLPDVPTDLPVSVVLTGGAGAVAGVATLATRKGHRLVALEAAVRDLDDPAGNVRRIVTAVDAARAEGGLEGVEVYVELPQAEPTPAWLAAADAVAGAEAHLKFRTGGVEAHLFPSAATVAAWIDAALDRETSYKCTAGLHHALRHRDHDTGFEHHGFLNVLLATRVAFDGGSTSEVATVLDDHYANDLVAMARTSDLAGARRWFTSYGSCSVSDPLDDLLGLGLARGTPMGDGFGLDHLPYGVFSVGGEAPRVGVRYGDTVVDLQALTGREEFARPSLNDFLALGPAAWATTRAELVDRVPTADALPLAGVDLHLPFTVGDYVDFYASLDHASNVGRIFRPDQEPPLLPNWRHLPVGYHGRGGTVVVSGTPVVRPCGQRVPTGSTAAAGGPVPEYGPSRRLDIEAELGFVIGSGSALASRIGVGEFADHVFGVVGLNDWSARDIQAWEYVPLGPFLGKSFATSIGAWVTPLAALDAAWCDLPGQDPPPLPYLVSTGSTAENAGEPRGGSTSTSRWCSTARW